MATPPLGASDDATTTDDVVIHERWYLPSVNFRWYIAESDGEIAYGYANLNSDIDAEWGTMSISELNSVGAIQDSGWTPTRFGDIPNP